MKWTAGGIPLLWAHDIPVTAKGDLAVKQGAIYYGALTRDRIYVRTSEKEFDFPQGQANAETVYQGKGGISLSNFWRKLVVAHDGDGIAAVHFRIFHARRAGCCCAGISLNGSKGSRLSSSLIGIPILSPMGTTIPILLMHIPARPTILTATPIAGRCRGFRTAITCAIPSRQ